MDFGMVLLQDLTFSLRQLRKSPGFTITTIITLTLGIGANLAIFGLLYSLVLRSLPVSHPEQLVKVVIRTPNPQSPNSTIPFLMYEELRRRQQSLTDLSIWAADQVNMKDEEGTLKVYDVQLAGGNAFQMIEAKPLLGRLLVPSDDIPGGPAQGWPVVLSYSAWNGQFKGDPNILGKHLTLSGTSVTVVGVLRNDFRGVIVGLDPRFYLPLQFQSVIYPDPDRQWQRYWSCFVLGRLKPGVSLKQADSEMASYRNVVFAQTLNPNAMKVDFVTHSTLAVISGRSGFSPFGDEVFQPLVLLEALVLIVLALCCVNIAGLLIARNHARRHEFTVRAGLGATRWRLARQCLTEGFTLSLIGSILGLACAWWVNDFLVGFLNPTWMVDAVVVRPDSSMILIALGMALLTTLLFGAFPAIAAGRTTPTAMLTSRTGMGTRSLGAGRIFVPLQIGLSLVLVVVAGLFSHSMFHLLREPLGFNADHIIMVRTDFQAFPAEGLLDRYHQMIERIATMPGIRSVALTLATPIANRGEITGHFAAVSEEVNPPDDPHMAFNDVSPAYFKTMQIRLLAGREFEWSEHDRTVCLLNRSAAEFLFPHPQPLGLYVHGFASTEKDREPLDATVCRVIGLVDDAKYVNLKLPPPRTIYFPLSMNTLRIDSNHLEFMMRGETDAYSIAAFRRAIAEYAPDVPVLAFFPLQEQIDRSIGPERLMSLMSIAFAILALLLSAIGLYGLLAINVTQRTSEIGVRIALGAQRGMVLRMILSDAGRMVGIGVVLGGVGALFAVRAVKAMLYNTSPFSPIILIGSIMVLAGVALLAAYLPAQYAARIEPMDALRAE